MPPRDLRGELGRRAEALIAQRLRSQGFDIIGQNVRVGRLELDLIARRGRLLVVCEVRSRSGGLFDPAETIDTRKIARVRQATAQWLRDARPGTNELRFDAAAVTFPAGGEPRVEYYADAF